MKKRYGKRKPKYSCGKVIPHSSHSLSALQRAEALIFDKRNQRLVVISKDILVNQIQRDSPKIEKSFDNLCSPDVRELSEFLSASVSVSVIYTGLGLASNAGKERKVACSELLINALTSVGSATQLLRSGYVLQPGIIVRSVLESIAVVFHLIDRPSDYEAYSKGKLQSTKTIAAAKKAVPAYGIIYQSFSENFAHIGDLHRSIQTVKEYVELSQPLKMNLSFLRLSAWLIYICAELLFNELIENPRYWQRVDDRYAYNPSNEEQEWMKDFLGKYADA